MLNYGLAALSAILLVLVFPRFNLVWLAPVALTPLLVGLVRETRPVRRFLAGYLCGLVYWFGVCYWIQFVLSFHGALGPVAGWAVFLLFCIVKAIQMGVFALLAGVVLRTAWAVPAVAAIWVSIEITHGWLGFAWLALGNAGVSMSVPMRAAPWTGVYGLSFAFAMMAAALAMAVLRRSPRHLLWLILLALLLLPPALPESTPGTETAALVQPNIPETEQWTPRSAAALQRRLMYLSMSVAFPARPPVSLLVWPEVPAPLYSDDPVFLGLARNLARETQTYFLSGVVAHAPDGGPLNSALLISPAGEVVSRYDKIHLVPFGEFVPWPFGFASKISTEVGDFRPGNRVVVSPVGSHRLSTFICYESVFPSLVRGFVANGAELLVNISNDSWFDRSAAREQHLAIVRMRAAENRRWVLRSTNDGITAAIDPAGRVLGRLPNYTEAASRSGFSWVRETTFYTRHGDWFAVLCAVAAGAAIGGSITRGRQR